MDWDRYENDAATRVRAAERRSVANRLRNIARDVHSPNPCLRLTDLANELDPPEVKP